MIYNTYRLLVEIEGKVKGFEFKAVSLDAAKADIRQAYGDFRLIQWGTC
jgi:hypothetical protein